MRKTLLRLWSARLRWLPRESRTDACFPLERNIRLCVALPGSACIGTKREGRHRCMAAWGLCQRGRNLASIGGRRRRRCILQPWSGVSARSRRPGRPRNRAGLAGASRAKRSSGRADDAWPPALPERQSAGRLALVEDLRRTRRCPRHVGLRHRPLQWRQRRAGSCAWICLRQPRGRSRARACQEHRGADG